MLPTAPDPRRPAARRRPRRAIATAGAILFAVGAFGPALASAAGGLAPDAIRPASLRLDGADSPNPLDHPIVDVALAPPGADGEPRLLTLASDGPTGDGRLSLLQRRSGWDVLDEVSFAAIDPRPGEPPDQPPAVPFLVRFSPDRYAVLATSPTATVVRPIRLDGDAIDFGPAIGIGRPISGAGGLDVDGDGRLELVVMGPTGGAPPVPCRGTWVGVFDADTLDLRASTTIPGWALTGAVPAHLADALGQELVTIAEPGCSTDFLGATILGIRPLDGGLRETGVRLDGGPDRRQAGRPLVADLDLDGNDEIVVGAAGGPVIVDDATLVTIDNPATLPLAIRPPSADWPAAIVTWSAEGYRAAAIQRNEDGAFAVGRGSELVWAEGEPAAERRARAFGALRDASGLARLPVGLVLAAADGGCPTLLAPTATLTCDQGIESFRNGPAWYGSRPLAALGAGGSDAVLVAVDLGWVPGAELVDPAPWAAAELGPARGGAGWASGPNRPFALGEVSRSDLLYFRTYPVPTVTMEREAGGEGAATTVTAPTGGRVLVRVRALADGEGVAATPANVADFLAGPAVVGETAIASRVRVVPGRFSAVDDSFTAVALDAVRLPGGGPARRWQVGVVELNDWGEAALPVTEVVVRDVVGPRLAVETPFVSIPWPFSAPIRGEAEPDAEVGLGAGETVVADRRGRFELHAALAPWPQTFQVRAIDRAGNETIRTISVIGGLDYRRLPWQAFLIALILLLPVVHALRAGRATGWRGGARLTTEPDAFFPVAEIVELEPGEIVEPERRRR